jgi:hypothetical protein
MARVILTWKGVVDKPSPSLSAACNGGGYGRWWETRPDGKGGFHLTLPRDVLNKLKLIREPGESYSDVIA